MSTNEGASVGHRAVLHAGAVLEDRPEITHFGGQGMSGGTLKVKVKSVVSDSV